MHTVLMLCLAAPLASGQGAAADTLFDRLVAEAVAANPGLAAGRGRAEAAALRVSAAGALPDPTLGAGVMNLALPRFAFRESDFTEVDVELSQELPWPGTLAARTRSARAEAGVRAAEAAALRREIVARMAVWYHRLRYVLTARRTLDRQRARLQSAVEIAMTRYASGSVPQSDPLQARVARARLDAEAAVLGQEEAELRAHLKALRNAAGADSIPAEPYPPALLAAVRHAAAPREALLTDSAPDHPRLVARRLAVESAEHAAQVERLAGRPDFTITTRYGARPRGSDFFSAFVGLRVPLWAGRKQHRLADAARAEAAAARQGLAEERAALEAETRIARAGVAAGDARLRLLVEQVVPAAEATVEAALRGYRVGQTDFLNLLAVEDALYRARLEVAAVAAAHFAHLVMLEQLVTREDAP